MKVHMSTMTLRDIVDQHPEWLDLEVGILREDGDIDFVGASGDVMLMPHNEDDTVDMDEELERHPNTVDVVVFVPN